MQALLWALADAALYMIGWWLPVVVLGGAGFVAYRAAGDNERARTLIVNLFIAIWAAAMLALYFWLGDPV